MDNIKKWYAKETDRNIGDFDEYDNHICNVVGKYRDERVNELDEKIEGLQRALELANDPTQD